MVSEIISPFFITKSFSKYLLSIPAGICLTSRLLLAFTHGYVSVSLFISPIKPENRFLFFAYTWMYSFIFVLSFDKYEPFFFFSHTSCATEFSSPNTSLHSNDTLLCSLSSIEIKITPSSVSKSLANNNLGYINISQAECDALPRLVRSRIRLACSSLILNFSDNSSAVKLKLSL